MPSSAWKKEEHTSELQSLRHLVCRLLLEKTTGSASLITSRILRRVSPRQSPSSPLLFEMSSDAGGFSLAPKFLIFSSVPKSLFPIRFDCQILFFGPNLTELYCSRLEQQDRSCICRRETGPAPQFRGVEI